jgi:aspartyl-tRNA(Asn)/glutamyl-tRNA(Gln) amidotransferase subunit A
MSPRTPIWQWSAVEIAAAVRRGAVSPAAVVDAVADRMGAVDPLISAFCTPMIDEARIAAELLGARIAAGASVGPLAGVPVAIKDLICTKGTRTTSGSVAYRDFVPDEDDVVVQRLRAADALIVGKTNASEFGYGPTGINRLFPPTRNPWDRSRTPGGSSAGSAAAVAAGIVPVALGSDGGGSIRIPASFCGIYGIKPSMGRVPLYPGCRDERYPGVSSWESVEHIGPLSRSVADSALILSVIAGPDPRDRHSIPTADVHWIEATGRLDPPSHSSLRIAYSPDLGSAHLDPDVAGVLESAIAEIETATGSAVRRLALDWPDLLPAFDALIALDTDLVGIRALIADHPGDISPALVRLAERAWTAEDFSSALMLRKAAVNRMWRLMSDIDILLTPSVAVAAFDLQLEGPAQIAGVDVGPADWSAFSYIANFTGQPAASVPVGFARPAGSESTGGTPALPVGLQIIGRHLGDESVLAFSALVERVCAPPAPRWPMP